MDLHLQVEKSKLKEGGRGGNGKGVSSYSLSLLLFSFLFPTHSLFKILSFHLLKLFLTKGELHAITSPYLKLTTCCTKAAAITEYESSAAESSELYFFEIP